MIHLSCSYCGLKLKMDLKEHTCNDFLLINWMKFIFFENCFCMMAEGKKKNCWAGERREKWKCIFADWCSFYSSSPCFINASDCYWSGAPEKSKQTSSTYGTTSESKGVYNENSYVRIVRFIAFSSAPDRPIH